MNPSDKIVNQKAATPKSDSTNKPIRPNLADSSINQDKNDLEKSNPKQSEKADETDPEKEYIAGEKEGDFPPDIKMKGSLSEGSEFDTDAGTVGQQSIKDEQANLATDKPSQH